MTRFDAGVLKGTAASPTSGSRSCATVHGPVVGYANVGGRRVAISRKRSSYGRDTLDQLAFQGLTLGHVRSPEQFIRAFLRSPQTFNAFYADDRHIAEVTTGLLPQRAPDVDPGLPTNGDGNHEWRGFLAAVEAPAADRPVGAGRSSTGTTRSHAGSRRADNAWIYGVSHRVDLLNRNLERQRAKTALTSVVAAMNAAATQDLRAVDLVPAARPLLRGAKAPPPRARADARAAARVARATAAAAWTATSTARSTTPARRSWTRRGRRSPTRSWARSSARSSRQLAAARAALRPAARAAQAGGWHSYVLEGPPRPVRPEAGRAVPRALLRRGQRGGLPDVLWAALDAAGAELQAAQGPDPAAWRADATKERITFVPGLLKTTLRYTNRPTGIQQVISFKGHRATP